MGCQHEKSSLIVVANCYSSEFLNQPLDSNWGREGRDFDCWFQLDVEMTQFS